MKHTLVQISEARMKFTCPKCGADVWVLSEDIAKKTIPCWNCKTPIHCEFSGWIEEKE